MDASKSALSSSNRAGHRIHGDRDPDSFVALNERGSAASRRYSVG